MYWNWKIGGLALGMTFLLTVALTKPIGVSTEFVLFDAILAKMVNPDFVVKDETTKSGYSSANAYLASAGGRASCRGILAPSTRTGSTRIPRLSAATIST